VDWCLDASGLFLARAWDEPVYPFTCDATFGAATAAGIAAAMVSARTGLVFKAGAAAAFDAAQGAACGFWTDDETTVAAALDTVFSGVGAWWKLTGAGEVNCRQWGWGTPELTVAARRRAAPERLSVQPPTGQRALGYARNNRVHSEGDIAKVLLSGQLVYADGTPVDALRPGEGGATPGDNLQTNSRLETDAGGYQAAGFAMARTEGTSGPPQRWVLSTTAATSGGGTGEFVFPKIPVLGGRRLYFSIAVLRTAGLTELRFAANQFNAVSGSGIGPVGSAQQLVPASAGAWEVFTWEGDAVSDAGFLQGALGYMTGNAGRVEVAGFTVSYAEPGADITLDAVPVLIVPQDQIIRRDFDGSNPQNLPRSLVVQVLRGGVDVTSQATLSLIPATGFGTLASNGAFELTGQPPQGFFEVRAGLSGRTLAPQRFNVATNLAPPPTGGGGSGTTAVSSSSFFAGVPDSTAFVPVMAALRVKSGSAGQVACTAAEVNFYGDGAGPFGLRAKWRIKLASSGVWSDIGGSVSETTPFLFGGTFPDYSFSEGRISFSQTATGLSANTDYDVQPMAATDSGTVARNLSGACSAVGS